jgi:hypothetical protein
MINSVDAPDQLPEPGVNNFWYYCSNSDLVLVFVHGVLSDSRTCWLRQDKTPPIYWPRLLRTDKRLPPMGVYMGGYYTDVDAGPYEVRNCAQELFDALSRPDDQGRAPVMSKSNIVFVCHSTGGIVARYMLHKERDKFERKRVGLVLIASPSYGSKWADRLGLIAQFYKNSLGIQLRWGNWSLRELDDNFKNLVHRKQIPELLGVEAYENHFIVHRRFLPDRYIVVGKESAGRYFDEPILLRNTNHFTSVKPDSLRHPAHELLVDFMLAHFSARALATRSSPPPIQAASTEVASPSWKLAGEDNAPHFSIPALPEIDASELSDDRFFGREGMLVDLATAIKGTCFQSSGPKRSIQLIWYHGFGGLGKSSLLRRAYIDARQQSEKIKIGLIDWYIPRLRYPVGEHIIGPQDLFAAIAVRLHQLFGSDALKQFWCTYNGATAREVVARRSVIEARFDAALRAIGKGLPSAPQDVTGIENGGLGDSARREQEIQALSTILNEAGFDPSNDDFQRRLDEIRAYGKTRDAFLRIWGERCLSLAEADDLVLRPNDLMVEALQGCIRSIAQDSPLLLMFDTHEKLEETHDMWLRQLIAPLALEKLTLMVVVAGRSSPRPPWLNEVPESRRRVINFGDDVYFTPQEILAALNRIHPETQVSMELAGSIYRASRGMPLAVGLLLDDYRRNVRAFDDWHSEELDGDRAPEEILEHITSTVTRRVLLHLDQEDLSPTGDIASILGMTIVIGRRREFFEDLWSDTGYLKHIEKLRQDHSFITGSNLHLIVRQYLRRYFRDEPPPCMPIILDRLRVIHQKLWSDQDLLPHDPARALEELNLSSWSDGDVALSSFIPELVVLLAYQRSTADLFALAGEISPRASKAKEARTILSEWRSFPEWADPWNHPRFSALAKRQSPDWSVVAKASLSLLRGLEAAADGSFSLAIEQLSSAVSVLGETTPRREGVIAAFVKAACGLANDNAVELTFQTAKLFKISPISDWTTELYGWHDDLINGKRSDALLLTKISESAIKNAEKLLEGLALEKLEEIDHDEFDPSPLLVFQAHMLSRHEGRATDALRYYRKVKVEAVTKGFDVLGVEFAQFLAREKRLSDLVELVNGPRKFKYFDLVKVAEYLPKDSKSDSAYQAILGQILTKLPPPDTVDDPKNLASLAVLLSRNGGSDFSAYAIRAISLSDGVSPRVANGVAWKFYLHRIKIDDATELARRASNHMPDDLDVLQTFLALLIRLDHWNDASLILTRWATQIGPTELASGMEAFLDMFRDIFQHGRALAAAQILMDVRRPEVLDELIDSLRLTAGEAINATAPSERVKRFATLITDKSAIVCN